MTEDTSRGPNTEDSIDDLGDPDASAKLQEQASTDDEDTSNDPEKDV